MSICHVGHFVAADSSLKSADANFGRFSPALIVSPHHPSMSTATFPDPSPTGAAAVLYTTKALPGDSSPCYIQQMCATLPNNATSVTSVSNKNFADPSSRCYMTLNPELYEIEYPYGQLKYHTGVYHESSRPLNSPEGGCATLMKSTPDIVDIEPPSHVTSTTLHSDTVEMPRVETQKRCRFKIEHQNSRLTPVLGNLDTSESTEGLPLHIIIVAGYCLLLVLLGRFPNITALFAFGERNCWLCAIPQPDS
ncbi:hypothetical protein Aperf_G00000128481 [Anoplocephala perfoliata]